MCLSVPQIAAPATRINTSPGPGFGTGQSRTSVPSGPSRGADLTTANMRGGGCYHLSGALPAEQAAHHTEGRIDELFDRRRLLDGNGARAVRQIGDELRDRPDQRVGVAKVEVLVQAAFDGVNAF